MLGGTILVFCLAMLLLFVRGQKPKPANEKKSRDVVLQEVTVFEYCGDKQGAINVLKRAVASHPDNRTYRFKLHQLENS